MKINRSANNGLKVHYEHTTHTHTHTTVTVQRSILLSPSRGRADMSQGIPETPSSVRPLHQPSQTQPALTPLRHERGRRKKEGGRMNDEGGWIQ